ncbi:hypothetical protein TREES_T100016685 [Tupaia chinensis]|uniref:Uncharacterized protein n=1 Tax=Tupaia chinensis TaxID=246437 RepID=L9L7N0_TUPCH|nr:hypothetical protein TREES_T100016685 [Tupaia chinensis]
MATSGEAPAAGGGIAAATVAFWIDVGTASHQGQGRRGPQVGPRCPGEWYAFLRPCVETTPVGTEAEHGVQASGQCAMRAGTCEEAGESQCAAVLALQIRSRGEDRMGGRAVTSRLPWLCVPDGSRHWEVLGGLTQCSCERVLNKAERLTGKRVRNTAIVVPVRCGGQSLQSERWESRLHTSRDLCIAGLVAAYSSTVQSHGHLPLSEGVEQRLGPFCPDRLCAQRLPVSGTDPAAMSWLP